VKIGVCRLCQLKRELCDSHALPNSAFRLLFRESDGKAVVLTDDDKTPAHYSSDSWDTQLLCSECEDKLNMNYDKYGINVFKGLIGKSRNNDAGVTFTGIDRQRLRMFFLSLLWRISVSSHESYRNIDLPYNWENELFHALRDGKKVRGSVFTVAIYKLRDSKGGFTHDALRDFIIAPFARKYEDFLSVCFTFFGFFVEIFLPKVPSKYSKRLGVLSGYGSIFCVPYQEVLDVPEIVAILAKALQKHDSGLSRVD
jgi:hypothetical protein